jgi:hypothetical protein
MELVKNSLQTFACVAVVRSSIKGNQNILSPGKCLKTICENQRIRHQLQMSGDQMVG